MTDYDYVMQAQADITPLKGVILVHNMEHGEFKTVSGIIVPDDNGHERGIRARWGTVWAIGHDVDDVKVGDMILVSHGRWTRGVKVRQSDGSTTVIRRVDPKDCLAAISE